VSLVSLVGEISVAAWWYTGKMACWPSLSWAIIRDTPLNGKYGGVSLIILFVIKYGVA